MGLGAALRSSYSTRVAGSSIPPTSTTPSRAADVPPIRVLLLGRPDPRAPYGVKGVGEISMVPVAPAVANAVAHAVGIRVRELPITPDKVLGALRAREGRRHRYHVAAAGALVDRLDAVGVSPRSPRAAGPLGHPRRQRAAACPDRQLASPQGGGRGRGGARPRSGGGGRRCGARTSCP